jgi:hypothetical protein
VYLTFTACLCRHILINAFYPGPGWFIDGLAVAGRAFSFNDYEESTNIKQILRFSLFSLESVALGSSGLRCAEFCSNIPSSISMGF